MSKQYISKLTNKKHGDTEEYFIKDEEALEEIRKLKLLYAELLNECKQNNALIRSIKNVTNSDDPNIMLVNYNDGSAPDLITLPKGPTGEKGTFEELTDEQKWSLKGEKGDKGDKGDTGEKGDPGELGPQGVTTIDGTNIRISLPQLPEEGSEYLYIGPSTNEFEFGLTYIGKKVFYTAVKLSPKISQGELSLRALYNNDLYAQEFEEFLISFAIDFNGNSEDTLWCIIDGETIQWSDIDQYSIEDAENLIIYSTKKHYMSEQEVIHDTFEHEPPYRSIDLYLSVLEHLVDTDIIGIPHVIYKPKYALKTDLA